MASALRAEVPGTAGGAAPGAAGGRGEAPGATNVCLVPCCRLCSQREASDVACHAGLHSTPPPLAGAACSIQRVPRSLLPMAGAACDAARHNAKLNGLEIDVIEHNVFDFLKHAEPEYDLIILDPPSFTRNKKTLMDAMRGYKEIHLRSLKLLEKGGILSTFCCSHHASRELFLENLADASVDAKKSLRLMQEHSQRADHPILITIPETGYLKGFTVEVIATR